MSLLLPVFYTAVLAPLVGFLVSFMITLSPSKGDRLSQLVTCTLMGASFLASCFIFKYVFLEGHSVFFVLFNWIQLDTFSLDIGLKFDALSAVMVFVVNTVSFLVHVYSIGYMSHDTSIPRFMAYLSLFTFMMLMLVTAPNMIQLFFGWEGVGLASYLLIGFWYQRESANLAAMKAFIVNRIGDLGLMAGLCGLFYLTGSLNFDTIFSHLSHAQPIVFLGKTFDGLSLVAFLLFIGAMGKSAQLGLHTWLPDAMEGPTPVSALIHAATMVTAGVFLVARLSPLYEMTPFVRDFIIIIGASTAFFAATVALTQNDIKRVIAYSTCSQLGYMFFAAGCSAYTIAIFHLFTHAFFKALLFLGAGSVIHAMSDEQDMQKMGGIYKFIPFTYSVMWIGNLALAGIPFFAGYYSKEPILISAYLQSTSISLLAYGLGLLVACLTAFYSWRLLFLTFHGKPRADDHVMAHVHESPWSMKVPLICLTLGSIFSGYIAEEWFLSPKLWEGAVSVKEVSHHLPFNLPLYLLLITLSGISIAWIMYIKQSPLPNLLLNKLGFVYRFLFNKWWVDELYQALLISPSLLLGKIFWSKGDQGLIDRLGPDGLTQVTFQTGLAVTRLQTGYIYHYAFAMLIGIVVMLGYFIYRFVSF
ncbi:MAG: NADH-quinone oxidoreductase subunit L [Proteobacteria bacterium]|nr:NADH-quinone oxidoreductase subunit L [Pseudomonadota bacterium]